MLFIGVTAPLLLERNERVPVLRALDDVVVVAPLLLRFQIALLVQELDLLRALLLDHCFDDRAGRKEASLSFLGVSV